MQTKNNKLYLGGLPAEDLLEEHGSPLYVYEEDKLREQVRKLFQALSYPRVKLLFACKANPNIEVIKVLNSEGMGIDAVSPGEVKLALLAGVNPEEILYTGNNSSEQDFKEAMAHRVLCTIGSLSQIDKYGKLFPNTKIAVRINPDVGAGEHGHLITGGPDSKFGIYYDQVDEIKHRAARHGLKIAGIHSHIGSGILDTATYIKAMNMVTKTAKEFEELEFVDFGGGIGVPYRPDQQEIDIKGFGEDVSTLMRVFARDYGSEIEFRFEPGKYVSSQAGFLLAAVTNIKTNPKHKFVGTDTGFNHLIRPTMYGAYHHILNTTNMEGEKEKVLVAGNICESGDLFTRDEDGPVDREIPRIKEGDVLAVCNAGAYGFAMSSQYIMRPRPAEVMVGGGKSRLIRRRETFEDLIATQKLQKV
ncbi:diaminopimelate decarboxylase [Candidatus Woesearchaeota archaeon]|nr:diaminopimelate decarboxylase [Candidatus Woesearchaeota archaeon]